MNTAVRMASRCTLAVGLTLFAVEIYPNPVAIRGLLCATLVSALPTFRHALMRQRLLLIWLSGGAGMLSEALFRDAPWFLIPFYFAMVSLLFGFACRSRDTASMVIIAYGLSGSLLNKFPDSGDIPIFDGFYRSFWCSIGTLAGSLSFFVFPIPKQPPAVRARPMIFTTRDAIFLGFCSAVALVVGLISVEYLSSPFLVMVTLVWAITLLTTRDKSSLPITFACGVAAVPVGIGFDSLISSSTNNLMFFLTAFLAIVWLINLVKFSSAKLTPIIGWFLIVFLTGGGMNPGPLQSFHATLTNIYSILAGMVVATIVWVVDQTLRSVEAAVERAGEDRVAC